MARVPIVRIADTLVVTAQQDLTDHDALSLQIDVNEALVRTGARGVLLDISVIEAVDSFLGRLINDIASCSRLLGAHTVLVGMQPAVAITLVELGLDLKGVRTALNAAKGLALLQQLILDEDRPAPHHAR